MGLADRPYMRDEYNPPRLTTILIVILIVCFVVQSLSLFYFDVNTIKHLGLSVDGISKWKVWQFFTFQFLHAAPWPWHVLFNCLGLYFFGRSVEESLGSKRFIQLYLLSGFAGGLLQILTTVVLPRHLDIPVVGASAGVCGMMAIFCSQNPMQEMRAWVYFFPITVRARYLLIFLTLLSLFGTFIPFDNVAHAAHLGGILVGIGYVRWREQIESAFSRLLPNKRNSSEAGVSKKARSGGRHGKLGSEEFISKEVDPILEKISKKGIHSLTDAERKTLEDARKKMEKR